jgi:hypothetical protein
METGWERFSRYSQLCHPGYARLYRPPHSPSKCVKSLAINDAIKTAFTTRLAKLSQPRGIMIVNLF